VPRSWPRSAPAPASRRCRSCSTSMIPASGRNRSAPPRSTACAPSSPLPARPCRPPRPGRAAQRALLAPARVERRAHVGEPDPHHGSGGTLYSERSVRTAPISSISAFIAASASSSRSARGRPAPTTSDSSRSPPAAAAAPDRLRDERHDRVQQAHGAVQHVTSVALRGLVGSPVRVRLHARLDQLEVPVRQLAPEEVVAALGRLVEAERLEVRVTSPSPREPRQDPAVRQLEVTAPRSATAGTGSHRPGSSARSGRRSRSCSRSCGPTLNVASRFSGPCARRCRSPTLEITV
jgi:hypothetical protein